MAYKVPLAYNTLADAELTAAKIVLDSGIVTQGREVAQFEQMLAKWNGVRHAIFVNSGSSANLVAIEAAIYLSQLRPDLSPTAVAIERGDEVIIQGLNWPSTIKPIINHGLRPVFCDVDMNSLNASIEAVEAVRTERTRMVVAVPVLGNPSHLDVLKEYCARNRLILIEDACESIGAVTESGRKVGSIGAAAAFSFYFSHHLTTIEGGAILTDNDELADMCYALRAHGWSRNLKLEGFLDFDASEIDGRFCFVLPGYNVRSTELNAAIGQVQLARIDTMIEERRRLAQGRIDAVAGLGEHVAIPGADIVHRHSWMTIPLLFRDRAHRNRAQASLEGNGVETRPIIVGNMLRHPVARMLNLADHQPALPSCDAVFERGIMIGLNPYTPPETEAFLHEALRAAARA